MIDVDADRPHAVVAADTTPATAMPWKENWCFTGVDPNAGAAMVWHISLRPHDAEGIYTCKLDGDDLRVRHVGRQSMAALPTGDDVLTDGHVRFDVVTPHERFALTYRSDDTDIDAEFTARFPPFDYADGVLAPGPSPIGELGRHVFPFHHYEQSLTFAANVRRAGRETLELSGWSNRDHSWGWRDDFGFRSHHWICASFDDSYVQGATMIDTTYPDRKHGGFVSSADGNDPVAAVDVSDADWDRPDNVPLAAFDRDITYRLATVGGDDIAVTAHLSRRYRTLFLNARHPGRSQVYQDVQLFCPFTRHDTGAVGAGLLEVGKHVAGEGIADRVGR